MNGVRGTVLSVVEVCGWVSLPSNMPVSLGGKLPRNCEAPPIIVQYSRDVRKYSVEAVHHVLFINWREGERKGASWRSNYSRFSIRTRSRLSTEALPSTAQQNLAETTREETYRTVPSLLWGGSFFDRCFIFKTCSHRPERTNRQNSTSACSKIL